MFCRILLLISLTSCVCGMFERYDVTLRFQAEEGGNVTVEWSFSSKANISIPSLKIHCVSVSQLKVFYHRDKSVDESLHEQFAGRVQCDEDALGTGRVRLHLSGVRTDDSGLYLCRMSTEFGRKVKQFSLDVSAVKKPDPVTTEPAPMTTTPAAESRGRVGLYVVLGLSAAAALAACCWTLSCSAFQTKEKQQDLEVVERLVNMTSLLPSAALKTNPTRWRDTVTPSADEESCRAARVQAMERNESVNVAIPQ